MFYFKIKNTYDCIFAFSHDTYNNKKYNNVEICIGYNCFKRDLVDFDDCEEIQKNEYGLIVNFKTKNYKFKLCEIFTDERFEQIQYSALTIDDLREIKYDYIGSRVFHNEGIHERIDEQIDIAKKYNVIKHINDNSIIIYE